MRRILPGFVVVLGILCVGSSRTDACWDKSLGIGRGINFQRLLAGSRPAAVLIYHRPDSVALAAAKTSQLQTQLTKAGHKSYSVENMAQVTEALKTGTYDLVVADLADAASLKQQIEGSPSKPVLIPVASKQTKAELAAAQKQYKYMVKNPRDLDQYLFAIYEAMQGKPRILLRKA